MNYRNSQTLESRMQKTEEKIDQLIQMLTPPLSSSGPTVRSPASDMLQPSVQETISGDLTKKLFAPYATTSRKRSGEASSSAGSTDDNVDSHVRIVPDDRVPKSNLKRLSELRMGKTSVFVPATSSQKPTKVMKKSSQIKTTLFFLLGDVSEDTSPDVKRTKELISKGLGPKHLQISKHEDNINFTYLLTSYKFEVDTSVLNKLEWNLFYSTSNKPHVPLLEYNNVPIPFSVIALLQSNLGAKTLYLRPRVSLLPLAIEKPNPHLKQGTSGYQTGDLDRGIISDASASVQPVAGTMVETSQEEKHPKIPEMDACETSIGDILDASDPYIMFFLENPDVSYAPPPSVLEGLKTVFAFQTMMMMGTQRGFTRIYVNREKGFPSALQILDAFKTNKPDYFNITTVFFENEPGVDGGALRKEFFWRCHGVLETAVVHGSPILEGLTDHKTFTCELKLCQEGIYAAFAELMVHSFVHTGVLCPGISLPVFRYITGCDSYTIKSNKDCPDDEDQETMLTLCQVAASGIKKFPKQNILKAEARLRTAHNVSESITDENVAKLMFQVYKQSLFSATRQRSLKIIRDIVSASPVGQFLRVHLELYAEACPSSVKLNPDPLEIYWSIHNRWEPQNRKTADMLLSFLENIKQFKYTTADFMEFVTAEPFLDTGEIITLRVSDTYKLISSVTCARELRVPADLTEHDFIKLMKLALHPSSRQQFSLA